MQLGLFDGLGQHGFSETTCFLCGAALTDGTRSDEHVFPRWLQHRFGLWDRKLALLNGTSLPYRQLKIPCCTACNNVHLSGLETRVQALLASPGTSLTVEQEKDLYLWTGKLLFGTLYRELLLPLERSDPSAGPIVERQEMERFRMLHFFLQSVRVPMRFLSYLVASEHIPASVFVYDVQCPKTAGVQFDFRDDPTTHCVYLRLGTKGILASFDGGVQAVSMRHIHEMYAPKVLHPYQLEELGALLFYKASTLRRTPYYMVMETDGGRIDVMMMSLDDPGAGHVARVEHQELADGWVAWRATPPAELAGKPVFAPWDGDQFVRYLATFTGAPLSQLNPRPGVLMSWLSDHQDRFTPLDLEKIPYHGLP